MPGGTVDEDGELVVMPTLHDERNGGSRGWTMQTRTSALAALATVLGSVIAGSLIVAAARRAVVPRRRGTFAHRRGLSQVRHRMNEFPEDELAHQQENHGPAMELKSRHRRSVTVTCGACNQEFSRRTCTRILLEFFTSSITKYVCVCCTPRMHAM